jgi:hypothetical protein
MSKTVRILLMSALLLLGGGLLLYPLRLRAEPRSGATGFDALGTDCG